MLQPKFHAPLLTFFFLLISLPSIHAATGEKTMVVTPDPRATQTALEVLKRGGNAVDAVVAAGWVLNVVAPQASGLGGGASLLFYDVGTRRILFFDGSVQAPEKINTAMFLDPAGKLLPFEPERNTGGLPVGVPGFLKLAEEVHAKYGTHKFPFAQLFGPAILFAEKGIEVSEPLARATRENFKRLALLDPQRALLFREGVALEEGDKLFQPELAKTFRLIQEKGPAVFYEGPIGQALVAAVSGAPYKPGVLSEQDLKKYSVAKRDPIHATYQSYDLFSAPPPSDGGVLLFRALNILSHFGVSGLGQVSETYHLLGETQKSSFSNRSGVADPDLFEVPLQELLSEAWAQGRAGGIKFDRVSKVGKALKRAKTRASTSVIIVDAQGNCAILTATLGEGFGSALRVPEYGFFLNDLLADPEVELSSLQDPESADCLSGGQRPRGPESPVFVFKKGKPSFLLNAYGPDDPGAVLLNVMIQTIDLGVPCKGALIFPRLLVEKDLLLLEPGLYDQEMIRLKLDLLGHKTRKEERIGAAQMVCFDEGSGKIDGESDPRVVGEAAGF